MLGGAVASSVRTGCLLTNGALKRYCSAGAKDQPNLSMGRMNAISDEVKARRDEYDVPWAPIPVIAALAGALLLLTAGGAPWGGEGWWAFAFLTFVPPILRWGAGALIVVAATPFTFSLGQRHAARIEDYLWRWAPSLWLVTPAAMAIFWLFRERTWHGDALYKVTLLESTPLSANPYIWKEPLDSLLEYALSAALRPFGAGPEVAIALMSVLAGGIFVIVAWMAARWLAVYAVRRVVIGAALLASGTTLLWFGHVENYSWSTALAFATVVLAIGHLAGRAPLWAVGVTGGAAVSFHPQAAFVLPALLVLLRRDRWLRQTAVLTFSGLMVPTATVALLLMLGAAMPPSPGVDGGFAGDPQLFWTPAQALAPAQLADALQNLWLIAPLWVYWFGIAGAWVVGRGLRLRHARSQTGVARDTLPQDARISRLLVAAAAGVMFYFFTFQNDLPRPRDWDLFAVAGPPLTLWGVVTWLWCGDRVASRRVAATLRQMLAVGLLFAGCYTLFWIGVNHTYTLLRPDAAERERFLRYRLLDLTELLPQATVTPATPICAEVVGCARVALAEFTMPQDGDTRPVIFAHAPAEISIPLTVPGERVFLWLSPTLDPQAWEWGGDGVTFAVKVRAAAGEHTLWTEHLSPANAADRNWRQAFVPLDAYRGQRVELLLITDPGPAGNDAGDRAGWGMPWLMRGTPLAE
jgi:hypothetical protein